MGIFVFVFAIAKLDSKIFVDWGFIFFSLVTLILAPRMNLKLPRSRIVLGFSDSMVFLAFLLFGGKEAIVLSALEMLSACLTLRFQGTKLDSSTLIHNVSLSAFSTAITYQSWLLFSGFLEMNPIPSDTTSLVAMLGVLSLSQFLSNSVFVSAYYSIKNHTNFWKQWKDDGFTISITQIAGASIAGVAYKLIKNGDYFATAIAIVVLIIAYFNYRKVIRDMSSSIEDAEKAQQEKADSEKIRAEQAEKHAEELGLALAEQEIISQQLKESNDALEHAAYFDALTKLPNRAYLIERLSLLLELGIDISDKYYVLFLDLKRFKNINNRLGHTVGDKVLMLVAKRLLRTVKLEDTVARLGGDEFAIILNDLKSVEEAKRYARKIHQKLIQPFSLNGHKIFTDVQIGISPFDVEHKKPEDILRDADIAMHYAKEKETPFAVFDKDLRSKVLETIKLESHLRFALEKNELSMYYQPLINLTDGGLIGFEALLRWHHSELGFISPMQFIPIAEDSGQIIPITNWILDQTTNQIAEWQKISSAFSKLIVSVNISGKHIAQDGLVETVEKCLKRAKLRPASLKLEITESTAMENAERTIEILSELNRIGAQLSIDDFGTGYSSLSYLHRLPFNTLKIDRSFVNSVGENGENSEILQTIISLAKNLKMKVIAEGIETESQLSLLRNLGCDYGQGFLMSKPLPKEEMETLLYQNHSWFPKGYLEEDSDEPVRQELPTQVLASIISQ